MTFSSLLALSKNTFRETIRDRILYTIVFFGILMVLSSKLMADLSARADDKVLVDFGFAMIHIFGIIISIFVGTQLIARETEGKTIMLLLSKPISPATFVISKFLGLGSVLAILTLIMGGIFFILAPFQPVYLLVLLGMFLSFLFLLALSLFFSSFLSPLLAAFSTLLIFVLGNITDDFYAFVTYMKEGVSGVFYWVGWGTYHFFPNFENINWKNAVVYGIDFSSFDMAIGVLVTILYIALLTFGAVKFFEKKEF
ncbi:MAG: ABC transporter permease subunit [Candidatus Peregrinibacteria bacterium]